MLRKDAHAKCQEINLTQNINENITINYNPFFKTPNLFLPIIRCFLLFLSYYIQITSGDVYFPINLPIIQRL